MNRETQKKETALFILFGTIEYDGRTKRMMAALDKKYRIVLVDGSDCRPKRSDFITHFRLVFKKNERQVLRHLRLFFFSLLIAIKTRPSLVVAEDYFTVFIGCVLSRLLFKPFIYDAHELIIPEKGIQFSVREYIWYILERASIYTAKVVVAANEERSDFMKRHYRLTEKPIVFRNIPPFTKQKQKGTEPVIHRRSEEDVVILYQGDIILERGIELFFRAVESLPPRYRLALVGSGPDMKYIEEQYFMNDQNGKFQYLGRVENTKIFSITSQCDIGIIAYPRKRLNNIYCASNKIYEYLQAGLPVISTNQPPLLSVITEYAVGEVVEEAEKVESVASKIEMIANNKQHYKKNIGMFLEKYNFEFEVGRVERAIHLRIR